MTHRPPDLPDEPREILGDDLWDRLGDAQVPPVPVGFDARFRAEIRDDSPWIRRHWVPISAGVGGFAAAAAALVLFLQPPAPMHAPTPSDDLALVAELEIVESLALLEDLDVLLAWDGTTP